MEEHPQQQPEGAEDDNLRKILLALERLDQRVTAIHEHQGIVAIVNSAIMHSPSPSYKLWGKEYGEKGLNSFIAGDDLCFSVVKGNDKMKLDPMDPAVPPAFKKLKVAIETGGNDGLLWPGHKSGMRANLILSIHFQFYTIFLIYFGCYLFFFFC